MAAICLIAATSSACQHEAAVTTPPATKTPAPSPFLVDVAVRLLVLVLVLALTVVAAEQIGQGFATLGVQIEPVRRLGKP